MEGGHRACIIARVANGCDGGQIVDHLVVATEALVHETLEAALAELVVIIGEIVPTHLVKDYAHHKFRSLDLCVGYHGHAAEN